MKALVNTGVLHVVAITRYLQGDQLLDDCGAFMDEEAVRFYVADRFGKDAVPCCGNPNHLGWVLLDDKGDETNVFVRADAIELFTLIDKGATH
jgi:hypothetical protein